MIKELVVFAALLSWPNAAPAQVPAAAVNAPALAESVADLYFGKG
jgi:hypothetical protein